VLAGALDAQAGVIVSGGHHLLEMGEYQGVAILTVRALLEMLASGK
jgi:predicted nucleic acid-binding protein